MAESNDPQHPHPTDSSQPEPQPPGTSESAEPTDGEDQEGEPLHPDIRTGFSAEQRRFLWTLTGLNVVAVLLGAAIIVIYLATARAQDAAVVRLGDAAKTADSDYQRTADRNMRAMIHAAMVGDNDAREEYRQEVFNRYKEALDAQVAWRRAQGLTAEEPSQQQMEDYMNRFDAAFAENLRMARAATTRAATQPTSGPASQPANGATATAPAPAGGGK